MSDEVKKNRGYAVKLNYDTASLFLKHDKYSVPINNRHSVSIACFYQVHPV